MIPAILFFIFGAQTVYSAFDTFLFNPHSSSVEEVNNEIYAIMVINKT
jgi:hypothetical protein